MRDICVEPGTLYIILTRNKGVTPSTGTVTVSVKLNQSADGTRPDTLERALKVKQDVKYEAAKANKSYSSAGIIEETTCLLNKGTYYVKVDFKNTYYGGDASFRLVVNEVPNRPMVSALKAGAREITGMAEKKSKVYAAVNGITYSAKANAGGKYTIKTPALKKGTSVRVYAENSAGKGVVRTVKVK